MTDPTPPTSDRRLLQSAVRVPAKDPVGLVAIVEGLLTAEECDRVIALAEETSGHESGVGEDGRATPIRQSTIRFLMPDARTRWLFDRLEHAIERLNRGYQFDLLGFFEGAQVAAYAPSGRYDWHMDLGTGRYSNRKLSLSVQLSDPTEYDGGNLEFAVASTDPMPRSRGALVAFPSFLVHRVAPVTRGTRWSLVSWISGPAFR